MKALLQKKALNGWSLFLLIAGSLSIITIVEMLSVGVTTPAGVSEMIGFSVRFAVPIVFTVIAISALHTLFPGTFTAWMLRNRKYVGLCFAVAMAWQGFFIYLMSNFHRDYYFENIFYLRDELEGSTGYIFLTAMVVTSFRFGRKFLSQKQWKVLHTVGLYYLWAYPFSVYWWAIAYYGNPQPYDYVFYWVGFTAVAVRIAAWGKKRRQVNARIAADAGPSALFTFVGSVLIGFGLTASVATLYLQDAMTGFLTSPAWSANFVLWFPFWPFEPFLSLIIMALGTMLATQIPKPVGAENAQSIPA